MATRKAQVVLSEDQYKLLEEYAREQGKTVSALMRENLEQTLLPELDRRRRQAALEDMLSMNLPVEDWEIMERQLEERWYGHDDA